MPSVTAIAASAATTSLLIFINLAIRFERGFGRADLGAQLRTVTKEPRYYSQSCNNERGREIVSPQEHQRDEQQQSTEDREDAFKRHRYFTSIGIVALMVAGGKHFSVSQAWTRTVMGSDR